MGVLCCLGACLLAWMGKGITGGGGLRVSSCLLINSCNFLKPHRYYIAEAQVPLKKENPGNINILISCAWQRVCANIREDSALLLSARTLVSSDMKIQLYYN